MIYEVHVRGFTKAAPIECAGTYAGAAQRAAYLRDLGVTAVEFLPLQESNNDRNDVDPNSAGGDNYWGYSTVAYFAPDRRYACDQSPGGPTREFRDMVHAFHAEGIKVLVDVVYNQFLSAGSQRLVQRTLMPLDTAAVTEAAAAEGPGAAYEFEPGPRTILDQLLPRYAEARLFAILLEASASFFAFQQRAMKSASDNADELIKNLSRVMNRARQDAITTEIMEIVGGAEAMRAAQSDDMDLLPDDALKLTHIAAEHFDRVHVHPHHAHPA